MQTDGSTRQQLVLAVGDGQDAVSDLQRTRLVVKTFRHIKCDEFEREGAVGRGARMEPVVRRWGDQSECRASRTGLQNVDFQRGADVG